MADLTAEEEDIVVRPMPVGSPGRKSSGWYGILALIVTEASLFVYLLFSYYYTWLWTDGHFLPSRRPDISLSAPDTVILILSSVAVWWGERGIRKRSRWRPPVGIGVAAVLGIVFLVIQAFEWRGKPFRPATDTYASFYFTITGFHMAHVVLGVLILIALFVWSLLGYFDEKRYAPVTIGSIYWHFVDVVWLFIFFTFYVTPYLG
jgi:heme/copper-type cytochrome/quinol oxidase subunit 3